MKIISTLILLLSFGTAWAASPDRSYAFSDTDGVESLRVYNDGRNTFIESVPGLVIRGATADGQRLIVAGTPIEIRGSLNGQPLVISRFTPSTGQATARAATLAPAQSKGTESVEAKIKALEASLKDSEKMLYANAGPTALAPAVPEQSWDITASDTNMRLLFDRWAKAANWKAVWDVDQDIPLEGTALGVPGDLKKAIRYVLSSTELIEPRLKPCFYINNVVRVVRRTAKCDPSE